MSKRQFAVVCALLAVVIVLLIALLVKTSAHETTLINGMNYLSEKIDTLTSYVKMAE